MKTLAAETGSLAVLLPEQAQQVSVIAHIASYSDMLVAVAGAVGSGKSTLAFELLRQHPNAHNTLLITADIMFGIPSLLRRIADVDQISLPDNRSQAIDALKQAAEMRAAEGETLLVVIDQAEQLDVDTLNEIAHLALLIPQGLSLVLFGTRGFEQHFRQGPAQAAVHIEHLKPLSEDSAKQLLQAIYSPDSPLPLSETELVYLHRQSAGLPGALILQAGEYFLATTEGYQPARAAQKSGALLERFPLMHLTALALLALALLFSYLYQPADSEPKDNSPEVAIEDVLHGLPLPEPVEPIAALEPAEPDYNYAPATTNSHNTTDSTASLSLPELAVVAPAPETPAPATKPVAAAKPVAKPKASSDADKLKALKQGVIVQLFGSYESANAIKFKQQWQGKIDKDFYQYQTVNQGKAWYVVVAGIYTNKEQAQQAIQKWPAELKAGQPWVRDISAVQQSLR